MSASYDARRRLANLRAEKPSPGKRRQLRIESLESRQLLSVNGDDTSSSGGGGSTPTDPGSIATPFQFYPPQQQLVQSGGFLTGPTAGTPLEIARNYLTSHAAELGLTTGDVASAVVTNQVRNSVTGATHLYFMQTAAGLNVVNATLNVNVTASGQVINVGSSFVPHLSANPPSASEVPLISAVDAVSMAAARLGLTVTSAPVVKSTTSGNARTQQLTLVDTEISQNDIPAKLVYVPVSTGGVELSWEFYVRTPDGDHWYDVKVDSSSGALTALNDWTDEASYNVYAVPGESPDDGPRTILTNPADSVASPFGWHDTDGATGAEFTDTRGNNVFAQDDADDNDTGGARPDGGTALNFDFPIDLTQAPSTYLSAVTTNLFYVNNLMHDIHYHYGFDEASGNFQINNYGKGGLGGDQVFADSQDGSGTDNANFQTPPDGIAPRMQQYLFTSTTPQRDSSIDNGVIIHEYGHGVSNRLTGGPANSNALDATQSAGMGEGWSDWWALMFTQKATDLKLDGYPIGTYVLGNTAGIRTYPYSFNMGINPQTYGNINTIFSFPPFFLREPHLVGELWASVLWDVNWLLIDKYGFNPNIIDGYTGPNSAGNILALQLVMDGLKLQPANPSFLDARDAILAADMTLTGGANQEELWTAFARRGMGLSAFDGGSGNADTVVEAFDKPNFDPKVSINDVTRFEGDAGTTEFVFTVSLSKTSPNSALVSYATANGTATAPTDYTSTSGVLTFAPGETTKQVTVLVNGDEIVERNESFFVNLSSATRAIITDGVGEGTILNEDVTPPTIYVGDITITQATTGPTTATFTVALSTVSTKSISVNYATSDGTAIAGSDYTSVSGLLTFAPGVLNQTVTVPIAANTAGERDEYFNLLLSSPVRVLIADPLGVATIVNSIPDPTEVIVDNGDAGFTQSGSWSLGTNLTGYGLDYMYSAPGNGQDRVSWTVDNLPSDVYHVYTRWVPFANRATNAPFTVYDDTHAMGTMLVDQTKTPADNVANAVNWKSLGTFNITSGTLAVMLSDAANGYVTADALRIVRGDGASPAAEIDVVGNSLSILDGDITPTNSDSTDFGTVASVTGAVTRTFTIRNQGAVALHLNGSPKVQISGANADDFKVVAQPADTLSPITGVTTFSIVFAPTAQGLRTATVTIASDDADEALYDFSIQGIGGVAGPTEQIIDDGGSGFTQSGSWQTTQNTIANQGDLRTSAAGNGGDSAGWTFNNLSPGVYQVYATWVGFSNRATNAPYTIVDGTQQEAVVPVNQQLFPNDVAAGGINWESLGTYTIAGGSLKVGLSDAANGVVVADAIRIVRTGDVPAALASASSAGSSALAQASAAPAAPAAAKAAVATTSAVTAAAVPAAATGSPLTSSALSSSIALGRISARQRANAADRVLASTNFADILHAARRR